MLNRRIQSMFVLSATALIFSAVCIAQEPDRNKLSPTAQQVANLISIDLFLARLPAVAAAREPGATGLSLEELSLHQQITEAVVAASLDVDSVLDQIDNERAQIVELQSMILARRQRAIGTTNLATLALGTGLGAVGGILQFSETTKSAGDAIGFAAGGLSTLLSFRSLHQQHSEGRPAWILPNMLAPFFSDPQERHKDYPADTWAYLNSPPDGAASLRNRKEQLLAQWLKDGRFPPLDSPKSAPKIALLTSTDAMDKKLDMDLLSERAAMLADVQNEVTAVKRALTEILNGIRVSR